MASTAQFNPDAIARYEAGGWRAYYDRRWPQLLGMTITLCQEQFRIPFPQSLKAAYHIVRASMAWVPVDHDERAVLEELEAFYMLAARYSPLDFDPVRVAALEFRYFDDHRRLVGNPDKADLIATLTALHSAIFGITPEAARESAEYRVRAMNTVDTITGGTSRDVPGDWDRLEADLRRCYRSIGEHLARKPAAAVAARSGTGEVVVAGGGGGTAVRSASERACRRASSSCRLSSPFAIAQRWFAEKRGFMTKEQYLKSGLSPRIFQS